MIENIEINNFYKLGIKMRVKNQGYALIVILWSLVIIGIVFVNLVDEIELNNLLVKNNLESKQLKTAAVNGVMRGINLLTADETRYDNHHDQWRQKVTGELDNGVKYRLKIKDIGSKLNINYTPYEILSKSNWWSNKIKKKVENEPLIPRLSFVKGILGEKYKEASRSLTTYGKFNLNSSRISSLKKLLKLKGIDKSEIDRIVSQVETKRNETGTIDSLEDLPALAGSMNFDKIKTYLTTQGRMNINLIPEKRLTLVLKGVGHEGLSGDRLEESVKRRVEKIVEYRKNYPLKSLKQLQEKNIIPLKKIKPYFSTYSSYLRIQVTAFKPDRGVEKRIKVIVKREKNDNKWEVEILDWIEEESKGD